MKEALVASVAHSRRGARKNADADELRLRCTSVPLREEAGEGADPGVDAPVHLWMGAEAEAGDHDRAHDRQQ